ncbi:MAG: hypothetical protein LBO75_02385 [Bifidobacteriaceae bacterium]|nr:hypothetical protein [Bifidobacteriaceae bacterium]
MTVGVIALLSALSAGSQMIARLALGPAFRKVPDRVVMGAALGTLALSMFSVLLLPGIAG